VSATDPSPWYVSGYVVHRWLAITRRDESHYADALVELQQLARATMDRYERPRDDGSLPEPRVTRTGAYQYRSAYTRIRGVRTQVDFIVSMKVRAEGPKPQLVDIHWGGERR